jgi:uncharacterized phage-associated protein
MATIFDVGNYFIAKSEIDNKDITKFDLMTNMRLQKLVYYAQGVYTSIVGAPLFSDPIEAWTFGPVSPTLYQKFKQYEKNQIQTDILFEEVKKQFSETDLNVLDIIYKIFSSFSTQKLVQMSRNDKAWLDIYDKNSIIQDEIPLEKIIESCKRRFISLLNLNIEIEYNNQDERYIVDILDAPGAITESKDKELAKENALSIAFEYIADSILHNEYENLLIERN